MTGTADNQSSSSNGTTGSPSFPTKATANNSSSGGNAQGGSSSGGGPQDKNIGTSTFDVWLQGINAIILFPALTTPCLVQKKDEAKGGEAKDDGTNIDGMNVVIAVHEKDFLALGQIVAWPLAEDAKIPDPVAAKFHSHLSLVKWGNGIVDEIFDDDHYKSYIDDIKRKCFQIDYDSRDPQAKYSYKGWYLGKIVEGKEQLISLFGKDDSKAPFGTLHSAATGLYARNGYIHLFQLRFEKISFRDAGLYELVWLFFNHYAIDELGAHPEKYERHLYGKPNDDLLTKVFEEGDPPYSDKTKSKQSIPPIDPDVILLEKNHGTKQIPTIKDGKPDHLNRYRLYQPGSFATPPDEVCGVTGQTSYPPLPQAKENEENKRHILAHEQIPYMTQSKGTILAARHPVYLYSHEKEVLSVGTVADLHLSSRQTLFKFVGAQVIPGANSTDSPFVGPMAHESLSSSFELLQGVAEDKDSDLVAVIGDLYDSSRNCNIKKCIENIKTTGDLWNYMDIDNYDNETMYPHHIDGLMALSLILQTYYDKNKPIFFVTGNHEAFELPFGGSPRIWIIRPNAGIPADMNLTIYESALLYGRSYWYSGVQRKSTPDEQLVELMGPGPAMTMEIIKLSKINFLKKNMNWLYATFTPWKDCIISYGDKQKFIFMGWGEKEAILSSGFRLPTANDACTENQIELLEDVAKNSKQGDCNTIISHFTIVNYKEDIPLSGNNGEGDEQPITPGDDSDYALGELENNGQYVVSLLQSRKIQYMISGHAHRPGIYQFTSPSKWFDGLKNGKPPFSFTVRGLGPEDGNGKDWTYRTFSDGIPVAIVTGSAGPYSKQNLTGEFRGYGMDRPQGLVFKPTSPVVPGQPGVHTLPIVRFKKSSNSPKPRLAVVLDYLWCIKGISPFDNFGNGDIFCDPGQYVDIARINSTKVTDNYMYKRSKAFEEIIGGDPIASIGLHAISSAYGKYYGGTIIHKYNESSKESDIVQLNFRLDDMNIFCEQFSDKGGKSIDLQDVVFFFSVKLKDIDGKGSSMKLSDRYDLNSPWCYPVKKRMIGTVYSFSRYSSSFERTGSELPDFKLLNNFDEYKKRTPHG